MITKSRTYAHRKEQIKRAVARRRKKIRNLAIVYKGSKCQICGYDRYVGSLNFHHIDPASKEFGISQDGLTRSWERVKREIEKCILLCANCHAEVHDGITQLPVATPVEQQG